MTSLRPIATGLYSGPYSWGSAFKLGLSTFLFSLVTLKEYDLVLFMHEGLLQVLGVLLFPWWNNPIWFIQASRQCMGHYWNPLCSSLCLVLHSASLIWKNAFITQCPWVAYWQQGSTQDTWIQKHESLLSELNDTGLLVQNQYKIPRSSEAHWVNTGYTSS